MNHCPTLAPQGPFRAQGKAQQGTSPEVLSTAAILRPTLCQTTTYHRFKEPPGVTAQQQSQLARLNRTHLRHNPYQPQNQEGARLPLPAEGG